MLYACAENDNLGPHMQSARPRVYAVVATYRRAELLQRLLLSLRAQGDDLRGLVLVDNGQEPASAALARQFPGDVRVLTPAENLGTGGGLGLGFGEILHHTDATHLWVLDDDVIAQPGALAQMLAAQSRSAAAAVSPLVPDARNLVKWFPGPLSQPAWDVIRSGVTPEQFVAQCGTEPLRWNWATWASLLVTREAVEAVGLPRTDFWYQATDIEYTLRLSHKFPCVLAPVAVCLHLPPPESIERRRLKDVWGLQNNAFLSVRLRHGWRALRHLPGNHYRFWKKYRLRGGALRESLSAFWRGAVCGMPVGADAFYAAQRRNA